MLFRFASAFSGTRLCRYLVARVAFSSALGALWVTGCRHTAPPPVIALPAPAGGGGGGMKITGKDLEIRPPMPDLSLNLNWLDLDEFFPPGARRVGPHQPYTGKLAAERRLRFPTVEDCVSPDGRYTLFHDGLKRKQRDIHHWLMLLKKDAPFPNTIFGTTLAFDVSWAEDSAHFAVTHYLGRNSSEVFVVSMSDLERRAIDVSPMIAAHFSPYLTSVPLFLKAYRWTTEGQLVVRGIARAPLEPYDLFGCEVLVSFGSGPEPEVRYLRGYIKSQQDR